MPIINPRNKIHPESIKLLCRDHAANNDWESFFSVPKKASSSDSCTCAGFHQREACHGKLNIQ
ncbi:hypothetical protein P691DRAFT_810699 [Macrolepiota fuliginosa MF-IS2]|uniref:Uncharacterized protein n=1 Tax=Macrolepiota fuliginosa MF-IS2 TaxID=1400762 RepID=A0A9P6C5X5_9AGAR|nr:hypothetical protein P691DRAFT_810699 [Macrolepiota fuliginosa MF-IS2]